MRCGLDHTAPVELCRILVLRDTGSFDNRLTIRAGSALPRQHKFPEAWFPSQRRAVQHFAASCSFRNLHDLSCMQPLQPKA